MQQENEVHQCSGSDTLIGSANVAASIFILLLLGFVGGVLVTSIFMWFKQRKQTQLDLEYRDRNKNKAIGDIPDVEDLIKSARFVTDSDDGTQLGPGRGLNKDSLDFVGETISTAPGPLQGGSQRCVDISIEGSNALLRLRKSTLSQAEEVNPQYGAFHSRTVSNVTDPESPLPNNVILKSHGKMSNIGLLRQNVTDAKFQEKKIGSEIFFEDGARLDASASSILEDNPKKKASSFDPPFQSAWKRMSMDRNILGSFRKSTDSIESVSEKIEPSQHPENPEDGTVEKAEGMDNNPFATTKSAIREAEDAMSQMV